MNFNKMKAAAFLLISSTLTPSTNGERGFDLQRLSKKLGENILKGIVLFEI